MSPTSLSAYPSPWRRRGTFPRNAEKESRSFFHTFIHLISIDYSVGERRHSIHSNQDGRWPIIEEHDSEGEEVEEEIPVHSDQETGKNIAIKLFQQNTNVEKKTNKKEEEELKIDETCHLKLKSRTLSNLINQFEDNISNSSVSLCQNLSSLSPNKPRTVCHAEVHSAPREEGEVFCSLSVANRIKMLDHLNSNNNNSNINKTGPPTVSGGSVAARVREIEHNNDDINETNPQKSMDLSAIKFFRRPSVPESYEDIQYLRALVNSQSNMLSCSTQRLDRIELNFEKVSR